MEENIADLIRYIEGWWDPAVDDEAPRPPAELVAFLRELVTGLRELPPSDKTVAVQALAGIVRAALLEMPGEWRGSLRE